jgi:acyl-CoA synthetase (AMP-forming)/AMP-acid ligase II
MTKKMVAPELFRPPVDFPDVPYDHLFRQVVRHHPDRLAIVYRNMSLTYREVLAMVNCIANGLIGLGLRKGDCLCIYAKNCPEYPLTFLAAASLGLVVSPIPAAYQDHEIRYQLEHTEAKAILVQRELVAALKRAVAQKSPRDLQHVLITGEHIPDEFPKAISLARFLHEQSPRFEHSVEISPDDLLAIPYSSGATGLPQGVRLTHRNLVSNNLQFIAATSLDTDDVALLFLPFSHSYGMMLTGSFLACGGTQVLMEHFELMRSLELSAKYGVTYYFVVPSIIQFLANAPVDLSKLKSVKYIISAALPIKVGPAQALQKRAGIQVIQGYGLTEASPVTHCQPREKALQRVDSVGWPVHNTKQKIVDLKTGEHEVPRGEIGELIVKGPQVMQGYWKAPEETKRALRDGWLYTGDVGYIDADGYTHIVDRKQDMIKYRGLDIAPAELESVLLQHLAVIDAAVIGVPNEEAGELIKAFVVPAQELEVTAEELLTFANGKFPGGSALHLLEFVDSLPKTASGKILRRELREREKASGQAQRYKFS